MIKIQQKATERVNECLERNLFNKTELSQFLGLTRPTLNLRLKKSNWRRKEIKIIFSITEF